MEDSTSTTGTGTDPVTESASSSSPRRPPRRPLVQRTSSKYYGRISEALFPSLPSKVLKQWRIASGISKFASRHHVGAVWPVHDLVATELLMWLLPTHMLTHLIKFVVGLLVWLGGFLWCTMTHQAATGDNDNNNNNNNEGFFLAWALFGIAIPLWVYSYHHTVLYAIGKPWMDPKVPAVNRTEMHVPLRLFECSQKARRAACLPQMVSRVRRDAAVAAAANKEEDDGDACSYSFKYDTPNVLLLDDKDWKFQLLPTVEEALTLVYQDHNHHPHHESVASLQDDDWSPIVVPGHWMLQGFNDKPVYTNKKYPFPCRPPIVPRQNPTGVYKLNVQFPEDWMKDESSSSSSSSLEDDEITLLLHGIESACFVFWNGEMLGFFKDSRLPSEFVVPRELVYNMLAESSAEEQLGAVLHIVVVRWSDGTYVEDQDHWMMAGIHRSVELIRRRPGADILDYHVEAPASGDLCVSVQLRESSKPQQSSRTILARLYDDEQLTADGDWKANTEIWSQRQSVEDPTSTTLQFKEQIPGVRLWTAETPHLYTLVLEQIDDEHEDDDHDSNGRITQVESCRVGFRSIDVDGGILQVNGKRITICGINRHEHDPDHGKVVSMERMKQDITVLKYVL
jgi:hypothetical protein